MTGWADRRLVVQLALETTDLDRSERAALRREAERVDKQVNKQANHSEFCPPLYKHVFPRDLPPCTYSTDHDKATCPCRGDGRAFIPIGGWSRLAQEVQG